MKIAQASQQIAVKILKFSNKFRSIDVEFEPFFFEWQFK